MAEPYLGEIRDLGFVMEPRGWAKCDGQLLPINQYQSLYSLIGTSYGGDGRTTFALPDLRGRVPLGMGENGSTVYKVGDRGGTETITLREQNLPAHSHELLATSNESDSDEPMQGVLANTRSNLYASPTITPTLDATLKAGSVGNTGYDYPLENRQPLLATNYCIAIQGIFPSRA